MGCLVTQHDRFLHWDISEVKITHIHLYTKFLFLLIIVCSLLIILAILFFRGHRICYRNGVSTAPTPTIIPPRPRSLGLDSIIKSLPVTLYLSWVKSNHNMDTHTGANMQTECSICLGAFENEDKLNVLPDCNHAFHSDCLDKWLRSRLSCPLCRASLEVSLEEIVIPSQTTAGD